jgi:hypothetical protein
VETGDVDVRGGFSAAAGQGGGAQGAPGGVTRIVGEQGLTIGGRVDAFGTNAAAQGGPPRDGFPGGEAVLSGGRGELRIVGAVRANGGSGASAGGRGAAGAKVTIAGRTMALGAGIVTDGGDGSGNPRGPGGNAGDVVAYTDTEIFNGLIAVFTRGGDSAVATRGLDGQTVRSQGPTAATLTDGRLAFTTKGGPVQGYRVLRSLAGTDPEPVWQGTATSGIVLPRQPPCVKADYSVVAFQDDLSWVSAPTAPVSITRNPAPGQRCTTPARVRLVTPTVRTTAAALKRSRGQLRFRVVVRGVGKLTVTVTRNGRAVATTRTVVVSTGRPFVTLDLPPAARTKGRLGLRLTSVAPVGRASSTSTGSIVVG